MWGVRGGSDDGVMNRSVARIGLGKLRVRGALYIDCQTTEMRSLCSIFTPSCKLCSLITPLSLSHRKELTADKGGVEITSDPGASGGKVHFTVDRLREVFILRFHITNKGPDCVHFTYYTALHKMRCFTLEDERRVTRACPLFLCPGETTDTRPPPCFHREKNAQRR